MNGAVMPEAARPSPAEEQQKRAQEDAAAGAGEAR
jgi:hypothetical protein